MPGRWYLEARTADPGKVIVDMTEEKLWAALFLVQQPHDTRSCISTGCESEPATQLHLLLLGANRGYETVPSTHLPTSTPDSDGLAQSPGHPREISRQGTRTYHWWILISSQNLRHTLTFTTEVQCKTMATSGGWVRELARAITNARPGLQCKFKASLENLVRIKIKTGKG